MHIAAQTPSLTTEPASLWTLHDDLYETPDVTFVIPAYNEEALLGYCLAAISAEICRIHCNAEIIVVDNCSTDRTKAIALSHPGVRVVTEPDRGLVSARRAGCLIARGRLVANVDADTILPEGWLTAVITEFERSPHLAALSGPYIYYDTSCLIRATTKVFYRVAFVSYLIARFVIQTGSLMQGGNFIVRNDALRAIGGFNPRFRFYGEDTELACRLCKVGDVKFSLQLAALSSGRRFAGEGLVRVGARYTMNFFWAMFRGRPFTEEWLDFRATAIEHAEMPRIPSYECTPRELGGRTAHPRCPPPNRASIMN
jgi:glycosyltransferase involved in cell wall biosynthesis